jgi:hydroxymethylglutaryl-CoA lyase
MAAVARPDPSVRLRDVTLRDGLQDESPISTEAKLSLYEALLAAGIRDLELTSFVRADRIPALADAEALVDLACTSDDEVVRWGLVLNRRGADRALASGLRNLQFVFSVSEVHNRENAGRSVDESIAELAGIVGAARAAGASVEVTLATAFGCPYLGPVPAAAVLAAAERSLAAGVDGIGLADTIGTGVPTEVRRLVRDVVALAGPVPLGLHLHDTRGLALANALVGLEEGAVRLDGSVGGLGGCPFAPGASGNLPLEDLAHALEAMGVRTDVDVDGLIGAAKLACDLVGRPLETHVGVAGRRFATMEASHQP